MEPALVNVQSPKTPRKEIDMSKIRTLTAAILAVAGLVVVQFLVVMPAEAKSAKCTSVAVPGSIGTFVVTCSTRRP